MNGETDPLSDWLVLADEKQTGSDHSSAFSPPPPPSAQQVEHLKLNNQKNKKQLKIHLEHSSDTNNDFICKMNVAHKRSIMFTTTVGNADIYIPR